MATYTSDSLDKLCKQELIVTVLTQQSKLEDRQYMEEVRKLYESVSQLHSELALIKNVNNLLLTRLTNFMLSQIFGSRTIRQRMKVLNLTVLLLHLDYNK